ncbi:MAG: hypothetical protein ACJ8BW_13715 [Ktedonobacteraceae bacterium]|jgi:hypothetical protein
MSAARNLPQKSFSKSERMECLPPLSQDRARLLKLKWIALQASFRSTGSADPWQTSELVVPRFNQVASEYWAIWEASEQRMEVFQQWLDMVKHQVSVEMSSLWQTLRIEGGVEHKLSLHRKNWRAIEDGLSRAIELWTLKAGELEIRRLDPVASPGIDDAVVGNVSDSARGKITSTQTERAKTRQAFVYPKLKQLKLSVYKWAKKSNVAHKTVKNYLNGKNTTSEETRSQLAKSLDELSIPE